MIVPDDMDIIEVKLRDPDNELIQLIEYIKVCAAPGHSFDVVVDPDSIEGRKSFFMDGDGSFYIRHIKKNKKMTKFKDGKILENYLRSL
jgi:hypothetical protein